MSNKMICSLLFVNLIWSLCVESEVNSDLCGDIDVSFRSFDSIVMFDVCYLEYVIVIANVNLKTNILRNDNE